jgi:hypothetical protein
VLNAVVVEHGSVWRQHKRLPADLIRGVEGDTLQLLLTRQEFAQVTLHGSSWMWWKHTRMMR